MAYAAKIVLDSVSEAEDRLTTFEISFPRPILSEFNTHRMFSRNSASSRAIPVRKQLKKLLEDPFVPAGFGRDQGGMQSYTYLEGLEYDEAKRIWLRDRDRSATSAFELLLGEKLSSEIFGYYPETSFATEARLLRGFDEAMRYANPLKVNDEQLETVEILNVHKQFANRLVESHMWHTVIVTATDWSNFFALRVSPAAQPEIYTIAKMMKDLYEKSTPKLLKVGEWHLPFIQDDELEWAKENLKQAIEVSSARSGRVSYLTHNGIRDVREDLKMYKRLVGPGHMSPLEHPATPNCHESDGEWVSGGYVGNFKGWLQHRKQIVGEHDFSLVGKE